MYNVRLDSNKNEKKKLQTLVRVLKKSAEILQNHEEKKKKKV